MTYSIHLSSAQKTPFRSQNCGRGAQTCGHDGCRISSNGLIHRESVKTPSLETESGEDRVVPELAQQRGRRPERHVILRWPNLRSVWQLDRRRRLVQGKLRCPCNTGAAEAEGVIGGEDQDAVWAWCRHRLAGGRGAKAEAKAGR